MEGISGGIKHGAEEGQFLIQRVLDSGWGRRALAGTRHVTSDATELPSEGLHQGSPLPGGAIPCVKAYHSRSEPYLPKIWAYRAHRASLPGPQRMRWTPPARAASDVPDWRCIRHQSKRGGVRDEGYYCGVGPGKAGVLGARG